MSIQQQQQPGSAGRPFLTAVVDDDDLRRNALRQRLDRLGHASLVFDTSEDLLSALRAGREFEWMMVVLQAGSLQSHLKIMLGLSRAPLLLVTLQDSLGVLSDIEKSLLNSGRVDVVPLSCSDREIEWRFQLLMQRKTVFPLGGDDLTWGPYRFDKGRRIVWINARRVALKPLEFEIALEFFRHMNFLVTRERLYTEFWGGSFDSSKSRRLDVCVSNVRRKLDLDSDSGFFLRSVYGRGYALNEVVSQAEQTAEDAVQTLRSTGTGAAGEASYGL